MPNVKDKMTTTKFQKSFKGISLDLHGVRLPSFDIPLEEKRRAKVSEDIGNFDFLRALCLNGFKSLFDYF